MIQAAGHTPAPDGTIQVSFVPTVEDQARAALETLRSTGWRRAMDVGGTFLIAGMMVLLVVEGGWEVLFGPAMVFPIILATTLLLRPITRWSFRRQRAQNPHMLGPHAYTFSAAGVHIQSPLGTVEMPWSSFVRARETRELFLIFFARKAAYFVPRRALREGDERRLRELLSARLGPHATFTNDGTGR